MLQEINFVCFLLSQLASVPAIETTLRVLWKCLVLSLLVLYVFHIEQITVTFNRQLKELFFIFLQRII